MKINRCKQKIKNVPAIILNNGETIQEIEIGLFSNFFTIGINDIFFEYPDCDILMLEDNNFIKKYNNIINNLRCIKCCPNHKDRNLNYLDINLIKNKQKDKSYSDKHFYDNQCIQDVAIQLATFLGCNPIIVAGFDSKKLNKSHRRNKNSFNIMKKQCKKCMISHSKWLKNIIYSITTNDHIPYVDPFVAHSRYNDQCPDKLDLLKRLI